MRQIAYSLIGDLSFEFRESSEDEVVIINKLKRNGRTQGCTNITTSIHDNLVNLIVYTSKQLYFGHLKAFRLISFLCTLLTSTIEDKLKGQHITEMPIELRYSISFLALFNDLVS